MIVYLKNWKTNISALVIFILTYLYITKRIDTEHFLTCISVLAGCGFIVSKDATRNEIK